jgi:hypothetical protein
MNFALYFIEGYSIIAKTFVTGHMWNYSMG